MTDLPPWENTLTPHDRLLYRALVRGQTQAASYRASQVALERDAFLGMTAAEKVSFKHRGGYKARTHIHGSLLSDQPGPDDFRNDYLAGRIDVFEFEDALDRHYGLT